MAGRVTQIVVEAPEDIEPAARLTQIALEQVITDTVYGVAAAPVGRVTQVVPEVIMKGYNRPLVWQPSPLGMCTRGKVRACLGV